MINEKMRKARQCLAVIRPQDLVRFTIIERIISACSPTGYWFQLLHVAKNKQVAVDNLYATSVRRPPDS